MVLRMALGPRRANIVIETGINTLLVETALISWAVVVADTSDDATCFARVSSVAA